MYVLGKPQSKIRASWSSYLLTLQAQEFFLVTFWITSLTSKFYANSMKGLYCVNRQVWNKRNSLICIGKMFFGLIGLLPTVRKSVFFLFNYVLYMLSADSGVISLSGAFCWNILLITRKYPSKLENLALQKSIPNGSLGNFQRHVEDARLPLCAVFSRTELIFFIIVRIFSF